MRHQRRRLLEDQIVSWFTQLLMALQHIHRCGFLHADVKASNILFTDNWRVQLADFGLSVRQEFTVQELERMKHNHECNGTPNYMAPELFQSKPPTTATDCWAAGIVLFEMATLDFPFASASLPSLVEAILKKPCGHLPKEYSEQLDNATQQLLSKRPNLRPTTTSVRPRLFFFYIYLSFVY
jgi:NIMA (never in mitosis gene a)-related kinase